MARETELKLRVAPEQMDRLRRHPLLRTLSTARAVTRRVHSVYYDTPDLYFHRNKAALRLRRVGRKWLQTLKGGGGVQAGLHSRNEWETPVRGPALDLHGLEAQGAMHIPDAVRDKLQPIFVTDFSRTSRVVVFEGAEIEICLDSGEISTGEATRPISELELELKSGKPLQLFRLALALLDSVPLEIESTSKAEYGYRLFADTKPAKVRPLVLSETMSISSALQSMVWSCLQRLQENLPGAERNLDDEHLRELHTALCRLRVVLNMANKHRGHDDELAGLRRQVAELSAAVERLDQRAIVQDKLRQQESQRLLLRCGAWMAGNHWRSARAGDAGGLADFALQTVRQCREQVEKLHLRFARKKSPATARALQAACAKLEYCADVFGPLHAATDALREWAVERSEIANVYLGAGR